MENNSGLNYQSNSGPNIAGGATNPTYHHYRSAGHNGAKTFLKSQFTICFWLGTDAAATA